MGRLRPHFTDAVSPSTSRPFAHAWAACSAEPRSLKLTKAHLEEVVSKESVCLRGMLLTLFLQHELWILIVWVVRQAGNGGRESEYFVLLKRVTVKRGKVMSETNDQLERLNKTKRGLTMVMSSGGFNPCDSACAPIIFFATGSFRP